jgi:hypothetical protein
MRSHNFVFNPKVVQSHYVFYRSALEHVEILDCENIVLVPLEFETRSVIYDRFYLTFIKKVVYPLLVHLHVGTIYRKLLLLQI